MLAGAYEKADIQVWIGDDIVVTVLEVACSRARLGVDAPRDIHILHRELATMER
jgi:carbon storage regulator CsrA